MTSNDHNDATRTRTIMWEDPHRLTQAGLNRSGLDFMRAMIAGELPPPPIAVLLDFRLAEVSEGRAVFICTPGEQHYNPIGVVHGGLISTLCDSAMGCAIHTALPAGVGYTTIELHINLIRALTRDTGEIRCEGSVLHTGRRMATAEAKVFDRQNKLYGHATTTCMVFPASEA
jgi:uncharacterized protein (TIGR00369 family)